MSNYDKVKHILCELSMLNDEYNCEKTFKNWSLEDKKELLEIYLIISKKEKHIFDLIYKYHGCDSWEDIFRDYDMTYLKDKTTGVEIAIDTINEIISEKNINK